MISLSAAVSVIITLIVAGLIFWLLWRSLVKRLSILLWLALAPSLVLATDPAVPPPAPPAIYIPVPPPAPLPVSPTISVPVGDFVPVYIPMALKARIKLSNPSAFARKCVKLAAGGTHSGILFSATDQTPDVFTMASDGFILTAVKPGTTTLTVEANGANGPEDLFTAAITVGMPEPPVPPTPPTPPSPPAPIPTAGFRVLMVYESSTLSSLPAAQQAVLYSKAVRDYLGAKTVVGPDSKTHEWRIWDQHVDTAAESAVWQGAMKRPRASVPWIVISDGKTGFEGPLPANADDALALLKKYGGQ